MLRVMLTDEDFEVLNFLRTRRCDVQADVVLTTVRLDELSGRDADIMAHELGNLTFSTRAAHGMSLEEYNEAFGVDDRIRADRVDVMIDGDRADADLMHTFEENNERFDGARDAGALRYLMARRAFAGLPDELAEACERRRCEMFV